MSKFGTALGCATLALAFIAGCGGDKKTATTPPNGSAAPPNNGAPNNPPPNNWNNNPNGGNNGGPNNPPPNNGGWNNNNPPPPNNGGNNNPPPPNNWGNNPPPPNNNPPPPNNNPPPPNNGNMAQQLDPNVAMVAQTALATFANTALQPGMAREGNTLAGNFTPGQALSQAFTIAPGKCYSIVAAGVGPGMEVDITAQASGPVAIPGFNPQFGQAKGKPSATGSTAVLGEKANCIKLALSPIPIQATYVITVTKGSGMVAAQLFSK